MGSSQSNGSGSKYPFEEHKQAADPNDIAERHYSIKTQGSSGLSRLSGSNAPDRPGQEVRIQKYERRTEIKGRPGFRELFNQPHIQVAPSFNIPWHILRRNVVIRSKATERITEPEGIVAFTSSTSSVRQVVENCESNLNTENISCVQLGDNNKMVMTPDHVNFAPIEVNSHPKMGLLPEEAENDTLGSDNCQPTTRNMGSKGD